MKRADCAVVTQAGQGRLVIFHVPADAIVDEYKGLGHQARRGYTEIDRSRKLNVRRTWRDKSPL